MYSAHMDYIPTRVQDLLTSLSAWWVLVLIGAFLISVSLGFSIPLAYPVAIALSFFGGPAYAIVMFVLSLSYGIWSGWSVTALLLVPAAQAVSVAGAAYALRRLQVDPLFRKRHDTLYTIGVLAAATLLVSAARSFAFAMPWLTLYSAIFMASIAIVPFGMRWVGKPHFSRSWIEIMEIVAVFFILTASVWSIATYGFDIAGAAAILLALSWIALELRPRFTTLAVLILAFAVSVARPHDPIADFFVSALGCLFLLFSSLEEQRRVSVNLAKSQMGALENAMARMSSEAQGKNDFIAMLAHELRNPLAPIASSIELMQLKERDEEEKGMLSMMNDRVQTIRRLLEDLLDTSRISEGKFAIRKEVVELRAVIERAIASTEHYFKESHQTLRTDLPGDAVYVRGDAVRLEQVVGNLLANASKYSNSGGTVSIALKKKEDDAEISVRDNGVGIPADALEDIFIPFHQAGHESRTKKGLGIGLALVRGFVTMHGGSIRVESEGEGKGSTFTVRFPRIEPLTSASEEEASDAPATFAPGFRVLVVDDNDAAAGVLGKLLILRGAEVDYAYDGKQGIDRAKRFFKPDLILLDIGLPDMEGYEAAKRIRKNGYEGRLIALTGYDSEESRQKSKDAGFDAHLVKPIGLAELQAAVPELR